MKENAENKKWPEITEQFNKSGKSAKKFAKENGLSYHALIYHIRKTKNPATVKKSNPSGFIQLPANFTGTAKILPEISINVETGHIIIRFN